MKEHEIQNLIYWWATCKNHRCIVPNIYLYDWESDVLSVTKAGFSHEFEIKTSVSDFKADFKKNGKHQVLDSGCREPTEYEKRYIEMAKLRKHEGIYGHWLDVLTDDNKIKGSRPNYFWYVCPEGMIEIENVPEYAGLLYIMDGKYISYNKFKKAPRLHNEKVSEKKLTKISNSFAYKYWSLRLGAIQ